MYMLVNIIAHLKQASIKTGIVIIVQKRKIVNLIRTMTISSQ